MLVLPLAVDGWLPLIEGSFVNLRSPSTSLNLFLTTWDACMLSELFFIIYSSIFDSFSNYFSLLLASDIKWSYCPD